MEVRTVGPSLGQDSKDKSVVAFTIGLSLVVIFMLAVYRMAGFVADVTLLVYVLILLGILNMLHATLTLPSVAGVILSIGMAVDANVLILNDSKKKSHPASCLDWLSSPASSVPLSPSLMRI